MGIKFHLGRRISRDEGGWKFLECQAMGCHNHASWKMTNEIGNTVGLETAEKTDESTNANGSTSVGRGCLCPTAQCLISPNSDQSDSDPDLG